MLAKNLRAPRSFRMPASSLTTFASKPAPTFLTVPALDFDFAFQHSSRPVGRCAFDLLLILILGAPLNHAG
ncbi:hypothetical protein, partial [Pseudomonas sp. Z13]|uniref:hypothetical protein n=1 Tax=Pseudomonas sp. Z13 TaxID=2983409 RepID=UPI002E811EEE